MITVRTLDTAAKKDVNAWVNLPFRLYAGNPYWRRRWWMRPETC